MSFANLKRNSKTSNIAKLSEKVKSLNKTSSYAKDERYWELTIDANGNGYAVIRFLPEPAGEESPFVRLYSHGFKNPMTSKWYIETCPTTIGGDCPLCEANSELWNTGIDSNKKIVSARKRGLRYISNILVVNDPAKPENNGKVFLYSYGARIFSKIESAINPEFEDETPFNPFDFWAGANFKLKARNENNQRSYDKSEFESCSELFDGDEAKLEELYNGLYALAPEIAADKFKPYDQLKARLDAVNGNVPTRQQAAAESKAKEMKDEDDSTPFADSKPVAEAAKPAADDDDVMAAYAALIE